MVNINEQNGLVETSTPVTIKAMALREPVPNYAAKNYASRKDEKEFVTSFILDTKKKGDKMLADLIKEHTKDHEKPKLKTTWGEEALPAGQFLVTIRNPAKLSEDGTYYTGRPRVTIADSSTGETGILSPVKSNNYKNTIPGFSAKAGDTATGLLKLAFVTNKDPSKNAIYIRELVITSKNIAPREEEETLYAKALANMSTGNGE